MNQSNRQITDHVAIKQDDKLTLLRVPWVVTSPLEISEGLWGWLSSSERLSWSSGRLTGRTRGGGPKCIFCSCSFVCDARAQVFLDCIQKRSILNKTPRVKVCTCRALILLWTFSCDKTLAGSASVRTSSARKMLSWDSARDPIIPWGHLGWQNKREVKA